MINKLIIANWKANATHAKLQSWISDFNNHGMEAVLSLPYPYLYTAQEIFSDKGSIASQDVSNKENGANTGSTTAEMLVDNKVKWVIIGHSERRADGEDDQLIATKVKRAIETNLDIVLCVGESIEERENNQLEEILTTQLSVALPEEYPSNCEIVIAYEPVWAIGTGVAATSQDAQDACLWISKYLQDKYQKVKIRILYGGSVKPNNAASYTNMPNIDGLLVGGASLEATSFSEICLEVAK